MRVEIVEYKATWPREFAQISGELCQVLGDLALRIDHIGSTSVPGLAAKDLIDVQVTLPSFDQIDQIEANMNHLGYRLKPENQWDHRPPDAVGPKSDWEKRFFSHPPSQRPTNVHVRIHGRPNWRYALLFRDYLRAHPHSAAAYAAVKRRLAYYRGENVETYAYIKDPVCDLIIIAAERWAAETEWQPNC